MSSDGIAHKKRGRGLCFQGFRKVCKTFIRRFNSDPRLQPQLSENTGSLFSLFRPFSGASAGPFAPEKRRSDGEDTLAVPPSVPPLKFPSHPLLRATGLAILALLMLPALRSQRGNPPAWNYNPMPTEGREGLVFGFIRPVAETAAIKVTAIVDGVEVHLERTIPIEPVIVPGHADIRGYKGELKMKLGERARIEVTRIEIREGQYSSDEKNPEESQYYEMVRAANGEIP